MTAAKIIKKFSAMPWEVWLHRRFSPFIPYLMMVAATPAGFKSQGINGQWPFALYDTDDWYGTEEMFRVAAIEARRYLKEIDIFTLTKQCEAILERGRKDIPRLCVSNAEPRVLFEQVLEIIRPANVYIWVAHAAESYYLPILRDAAKEYVSPEELETFIGDITFPSKKNALALMEEVIYSGASLEEIHRQYSWLKARGGFRPGYTLEEMKEIQEKVLHTPAHTRSERAVPPALQSLVKEVRELVYLRTLRTDALYEMYDLAQPIFNRFANELGIESVKDYIPNELLSGHFTKIPYEYAILKDNDEVIVLKKSIISQTKVTASTEVKGVVAYKGRATGIARLVHTPAESEKVKPGDILVTNMTNPSFISAMHRAAAFVTNEGGITCHAAILARELKKPCVIGTKIATRIFKDGDVVEVDAEKGIVTKIPH